MSRWWISGCGSAVLATLFALAAGEVSAQHVTQAAVDQRLQADIRQAAMVVFHQSAEHAQKGVSFDDLTASLDHKFRFTLDLDGNGVVEQADLETRRRIEVARRRASFLQSKLLYDLDGDGRITPDELAIALKNRIQAPQAKPGATVDLQGQLNTLIASEMTADTNKDGVVDLAEVHAAFDRAEAQRRGGDPFGQQHQGVMTLDANGDGRVTLEEFIAGWRRAFGQLDRNGDGLLHAAELGLGPDIAVQGPGRAQHAACVTSAKPEVSDRFVFIGAYEGKALSSVRTGPETESTTVADVVIEPGTEPLFVVLTSYRPNVWRFSGAVARVRAVVTQSKAGVVGIARERVSFAGDGNCLPTVYERAQMAAAGQTLAGLFGRAPDAVAGEYGVRTVRVPSGVMDHGSRMPDQMQPPDHVDAIKIWQEMLRFNPAGLIAVDPDKVVTAGDVKRYTVMPNQAGLAFLIAEGALSLEPGGFGPMRAFVIRRAMRFPAGLHGAHSVSFILPKGVPMPEGDPGHSCVISEETGKSVDPGAPHCDQRAPPRLARLAKPAEAKPAQPQVIRDCLDAKTRPIQICPQMTADAVPGMDLPRKPQPGNVQVVDTGTGAQRTLLPEGTQIADMTYTGRHGMLLVIAAPGQTGTSTKLRYVQVTLGGDLRSIAIPDFDEAYSFLPEGDALNVFVRTGEAFTRYQIDLASQVVSAPFSATREQADAIGHRLEPPLGRGERLEIGKTFPGYRGRELQASCMGPIGCLRQFLENDTDGDGRLSPADRKRLAYSSFDGKRNALLPYEVDEVLAEKPYLEGIEIIARIGRELKAILFDTNAMTVLSERPATAAEAVSSGRR